MVDDFTMSNMVSESNGDVDLGSGGAMVLPTLTDALGHPRELAVGAGKDGNAYVVDRNNMGKFNKSNDSAIYQQFGLGGSVFSSPAWFNNTLYYGPVGQQLAAYPFSGGSFGSPSSQSSKVFTYPGTTPSISANGSSNAIVWAMENSSTAVLHAYDAANLGTELYNSNQAANSRDNFGVGNKYMTPTIANGKVYAAATSSDDSTNVVGVFGLLHCSYSIAVAERELRLRRNLRQRGCYNFERMHLGHSHGVELHYSHGRRIRQRERHRVLFPSCKSGSPAQRHTPDRGQHLHHHPERNRLASPSPVESGSRQWSERSFDQSDSELDGLGWCDFLRCLLRHITSSTAVGQHAVHELPNSRAEPRDHVLLEGGCEELFGQQ